MTGTYSTYHRRIRLPNGVVLGEHCVKVDGGHIFQLANADFENPIADTFRTADPTRRPAAFPKGWDPNPNPGATMAKLAGEIGDPTLDIVTFAAFMADGRAQWQVRSYVSPTGQPVGNAGMFSINGGGMKPDETYDDAVLREGKRELGVNIAGSYTWCGQVYDPEHGRTNHVCRVNGYDRLLAAYLTVEQAVARLTRPEGLGRAYVWREDAVTIIREGRLTPISLRILEKLPALMPAARPLAA